MTLHHLQWKEARDGKLLPEPLARAHMQHLLPPTFLLQQHICVT
jgi:hypothetical protein